MRVRALGLGLVLYTVKVGRSPYVCLYGWMYNKGGAGEGEGEKGKGEGRKGKVRWMGWEI